MKKLLLPPAAVLLLCGSALAWPAKVKSVHDGDSINVYLDATHTENIRLYGIDAPETKQTYGYQAKRRLSRLVGRGELDIESVDKDKYGRTVALVRLPDGTLVNEAQVAEGNAWVYTEYCRQEPLCGRLAELEARARAEHRGLWAEKDPERPSDWRREHKSEEWYMAPVRVLKTLARKVKSALH